MATDSGVNQGKTAFLEEFLPGNRDANLDAVNQAWNAAGNEGTISESLFGKVRSRLGLTGKRGEDGGATEEAAGPAREGKARSSPKGAGGKGKSKAVKVPSQPEGSGDGPGTNKTAFVEEVLGREPQANVAAINRAWAEAGHEGKISDSIVYKVKRERGGMGKPTPTGTEPAGTSEPQASEAGTALGVSEEAPQALDARRTATVTASGNQSAVSGDPGRVVDEVEAGIDELMFTLKANGGMPEVEAALRAARRLLVRSQEG